MVHNYNIIMKTAFDLVKILLNNLFRFDLSSTCKLVLLSLADCYNPKHEYVFPKQSTIAKKLGITDLFKVTNFPLEKDKLSSANITNKEEIKEQDFDKNFSSKDSDSVKKTQELIGSFKAMELKEDYTSWSREQSVRHLVRVIPAPVLKKSPLAKYLMEKYSITIDEVMKLKKEHKPGED